MNLKNNFRKVTSFLAMCAGITTACICVLLIADEYHSARSKFEMHNREVQGWEACRQANPAYYEASKKTVNSSRQKLAEAESNFWISIPRVQLAGFLALGGLASATAGYLATWGVVLLGRLGLHKFSAWLTIRLKGCPG
ncbi:MAG: hypothetical protein JSW47_01720 [Phycisphaerales bacterium]|nr:MAG: hypothetical protein JSW47_01720 [Phycisphaerales bacterium]